MQLVKWARGVHPLACLVGISVEGGILLAALEVYDVKEPAKVAFATAAISVSGALLAATIFILVSNLLFRCFPSLVRPDEDAVQAQAVATAATAARAEERSKIRDAARVRFDTDRASVQATMGLVHNAMERAQRLLDNHPDYDHDAPEGKYEKELAAWEESVVAWSHAMYAELGTSARVAHFITKTPDTETAEVSLALQRRHAALRNAWAELQAESDRLSANIAAIDRENVMASH